MTNAANRLVFLLVLLIPGSLVANDQIVSFPSQLGESKSPNGRYIVRNVDSDVATPAHSLILVDTKTGSEKPLYKYPRHVQLLWSPTSASLIINDYEGSSSSDSILFLLAPQLEIIDLGKQLMLSAKTSPEVKSLAGNSHVYLSAIKWVGSDVILCKVSGYGDADPSGFSEHYLYKVKGSFRLKKSKHRLAER